MKYATLFLILISIFSMAFFSMAKESSVTVTSDPETHNTRSSLTVILPTFQVDDETKYKNLSIFPVRIKGGTKDLGFMTLDEATKKGYLVISEIAGGQVNKVYIENTSKNWIFLAAGEIIVGAKQNRMIGKDCLIPPKSGKIEEQVFCVEHGRWVVQTDKFSSNDINCNMSVRQSAKQYEDQGIVWAKVSESTTISNKENSTGKFDVVYEDKDVQKKIDEYTKSFSSLIKEDKEITGVVVAVGDEIVGADIFGDRELFEKLWPKLLKSYVTDALMEKDEKVSVTKKDVIKFLDKVKDTEMKKDNTAVAGTRIDFSSKEVVGGLIFDEQNNLVHYVQFPYREIKVNNKNNTINDNINNVDVQQQINAPPNPPPK